MWSLPDIDRLNAEAAKTAKRTKNRKRCNCEYCGKANAPAQPYYDIFSNYPKGVVGICTECEERHGTIPEGYFLCEDCGRLFVENYTWERYEIDGLCINCYRERELASEKARNAKHLLAVGQKCPKNLKFLGNVELDGFTGGRLTGFSSSESTPDGGVQELQEMLWEAHKAGHKKASLILDGAYQFSVSIGLYVSSKGK